MKVFRIVLVLLLVGALGVVVVSRDLANAQAQTIKIGAALRPERPLRGGRLARTAGAAPR